MKLILSYRNVTSSTCLENGRVRNSSTPKNIYKKLEEPKDALKIVNYRLVYVPYIQELKHIQVQE